ncbi:MAG TPA: sigma-70 family RNA polymerase sigma factor [Longimicrobiaceae bacterium]|nr:sigma-70 family RNA polymerase sigma factor [Longimicrobiaceae bacterium]
MTASTLPARGIPRARTVGPITFPISAVREHRRSLESYSLYERDLDRYAPLAPERELALARAVRAGDEAAREQLVLGCLRYAVGMAMACRWRGVPMEDLVQEANVGLMTAVDCFDPERGVRFVNYAYFWIRRSLNNAIQEHGRIIRVPAMTTVHKNIAAIVKARARLRQRLQREPGTVEVAAELGFRPEEVEVADAWASVDLSLDAPARPRRSEPADPDRDIPPLPDPAETPEVVAERNAERRRLERALDAIPPYHAHILRLYYGLGGGREYNFKEIGELLGSTKQNIHVQHKRALANARKVMEGEVVEQRVRRRRPRSEVQGAAREEAEQAA